MKELRTNINSKGQHERSHTWEATVKNTGFNSCIFFPGMLNGTNNSALLTVLWGSYRNAVKG